MRSLINRSTTIWTILVLIGCEISLAQSDQPLTEPSSNVGMVSPEAYEPTVDYLQRTAALEAEVAGLRRSLGVSGSGVPANKFVIPGWNSSLEFLNWTMHRRGLDFAIPTDDTADSVGLGEIQNIKFSPSAGLRASLGVLTQTGWQFAFRYTDFHSSASANAEEVAGNLWATRAHPDRGEEAETALAFSDIDYDLFDFELERWLLLNETTGLAVLGGFRWADINQNFRVDYDGDDFDEGSVRNPVEMTGFGLRMGVEGQWTLTESFRVFGRAAGTVVRGEFNSRLLETNFDGADTVVDVTDEYSNTLTAIELATGLVWQRGPFDLAVGYELTEWSNLGERTTFSSATHEGAYDPNSVDVLLEGLFVRGTVMF